MPPVPNYAGLKNKQAELIRKATDGSFFLAPITADPITSLTTAVTGPPASIQLNPLPASWDDAGWLTGDGMQNASSTTTSDITSFGSVTPSRTDITSQSSQLTVVMQETKMLTLELYTGVSRTAMTPDSSTGELHITPASVPTKRHYRGLTFAVDQGDGGEIYMGKFYPRLAVSGKQDYNLGSGDNAVQYGVTFTGEEDGTLGFSERWIFAGPGWKALLQEMGFTA